MPSDKRARQRANVEARAAAQRVAAKRRANRRRSVIAGGAIIAVVAFIALLVSQSTGTKKAATSTSTTLAHTTTTVARTGGPPAASPTQPGASLTGATPCPKQDGTSARTTHFAGQPPSCIDPSKSWTATFTTTEGKFTVALDTKRTAGTANNFILLSLYHYYDGTALFRIDPSIDIIQGGSPTTQNPGDPGPGYTINDEGGKFTYTPGDLVMARSSGPNSGAAQFFFVVGANGSQLNSQGTYVVFGHVSQGLDVLQNIEKLYVACNPSDTSCIGGGPSRVVLINSVSISAT